MFRLAVVYAMALLACGNWIGANAAGIHKWVDDKGITHYADAVPTSPAGNVTRLEISTASANTSALSTPSDHYYSIANQWQRLQQERLQQQQIELQKSAINIDRSVAPLYAGDRDQSNAAGYLVAYPARIYRRHGQRKRHQRARRDHGYAHQAKRPASGSRGLPIMN